MSKKWPELERGESSMVTHRHHVPTWKLKSDEYRMEFIENRAMVKSLSRQTKDKEKLLETIPNEIKEKYDMKERAVER